MSTSIRMPTRTTVRLNDAEAVADAIGRAAPFSAWPRDALLRLAAASRVARHRSGTTLIVAGQPCDQITAIAEGAVISSVSTPGGRRVIFRFGDSPYAYGLLSLVDGLTPGYDLVADAPVTVIRIPCAVIRRELECLPSLWESVAVASTCSMSGAAQPRCRGHRCRAARAARTPGDTACNPGSCGFAASAPTARGPAVLVVLSALAAPIDKHLLVVVRDGAQESSLPVSGTRSGPRHHSRPEPSSMRRRLNCLFVAVMLVGAPALAQSDTGEVPSGGSRDGKRSTTTLSASGESATRLDHSDHASSSGKSSRFTLDLSVASGAQPLAAARTSSDGDERVEASTRASQGK